MGLLQRSGLCALALIAGGAALQLEPATVRHLIFEEGGQRLAVGAVRIPLWSAAFAQAADSFSLENVSFTFGGANYEIKRVDLSGVTSTRAEIEALFAPTASEPLMRRLAKVNAKQITIPHARATQKIGSETHSVEYRNVVLSDIAAGRIGSLTADSSLTEVKAPDGTQRYITGRMTMSETDLAALAHVFETKAESASAPLVRVYGSFTIDNIEVVESRKGPVIKIARMSGRDFLARPTRDSWAGSAALLMELAEKNDSAPDDLGRVGTLIGDLMGAFDMGFAEATGIEIKDQSKSQDPVGRIGRVAYTGSTGSQPADFRMEGLEFGGQENRVKIGAIGLTGFSIAPTLEGLKGPQGKSSDEFDQATIRSLIPTLGTLRISGLDVDVADEEAKGAKPERVRPSIEDWVVTADKPVNGIPTNIRIEQNNFVGQLPANSDDEFVKEIAALGYKAISGSSLLAINWNEAASQIDLMEYSLQAQDMGSLVLKGLIGNATKDLFSADNGTALAAAVGAKVKSVDVVIEDRGLLSRYLAKAAKEQKTTPEALRRAYANAAPTIIASLIGSSEQAKTLGQAVSRFITKPGKLTINAQPKNPSGFGVMDAMLASDPKDIVAKLNITAKVE